VSSRRFPELTKTSSAILDRAAQGASLYEIGIEFGLAAGAVRSRAWAAVRRVWDRRSPSLPAPAVYEEIPVALLLMEAPELAERRSALVEALPLGVDPAMVREYLERSAG
jgi:hypothetical protein